MGATEMRPVRVANLDGPSPARRGRINGIFELCSGGAKAGKGANWTKVADGDSSRGFIPVWSIAARDNPTLPYRSTQTRLFAIHKEQQGASPEKYAPVVRTAVRARGRRHVPVNLSLCLGSNFARFLMHSAFDEFFVKTNRN